MYIPYMWHVACTYIHTCTYMRSNKSAITFCRSWAIIITVPSDYFKLICFEQLFLSGIFLIVFPAGTAASEQCTKFCTLLKKQIFRRQTARARSPGDRRGRQADKYKSAAAERGTVGPYVWYYSEFIWEKLFPQATVPWNGWKLNGEYHKNFKFIIFRNLTFKHIVY